MMKTCITSTKTLVQMYTTYNVHPSSSRGEIHVLRLRISTGVKSLGSERLKETTPDPADPAVGRSLSFHPSIHHLCLLSTNSGVAYSRMSDDLVRFRKRQHHPIIPSSTSLCTLLSPSIAFSKEKRHRRSLIQSIHCVASDSTNLRPNTSLSMGPNRLLCVQPPEHVDDPAPVQWLCIQRCPTRLITSSSFFSKCRCELRN